MTASAAPRPGRIYAIADAEALAPRSLAEGAVAMAEAGIVTIQLRAKLVPDDLLFAEPRLDELHNDSPQRLQVASDVAFRAKAARARPPPSQFGH